MTREPVVPLGPSATRGWQRQPLGAGSGRPSAVLLLPDAATDQPGSTGQAPVYVLPDAPLLAHGADGAPVLSLTLLLARQPDPKGESVHPLIRQGVLSFDVMLGVPDAALEQLESAAPGCYQRLYAREVVYKLVTKAGDAGETLASAVASGTQARAALTATLGRDGALAVLSALQGTPTDLGVRASVGYRQVAVERTLLLRAAWAAVHDVLRERFGEEEIDPGALREAVQELVERSVLQVFEADQSGQWQPMAAPDLDVVLPIFLRLSPVVLRRAGGQLEGEDQVRYRLRGRPHDSFRLDYQQTVRGGEIGATSLERGLEEVLGGALDGRDWDPFVHLVAPGGSDGAGIGPVLARRTARRPREDEQSGAVELAILPGAMTSLALAARPRLEATAAQTFLAASLSRPGTLEGGRVKQLELDDLVAELHQARPEQLPLVHDPEAPLWSDRSEAALRWYAPEFELVAPDPAGDAETGPFLFTYERTGVTGSGEPALEGMVRFTLRRVPSGPTVEALRVLGNPAAHPVQLRGLSVTLEVPFVDQADGRLKRQSLVSTVQETGGLVVATVRLLNDWVRLSYGALAQPGFQREPARLRVEYLFLCYVSTEALDLVVAFGPRSAALPVVFSPVEAVPRSQPFLDARELTFRVPEGEVRFLREQPSAAPGRVEGRLPIDDPQEAEFPRGGSIERPNVIVTRPPMRPIEDGEILPKVHFARRTIARRVERDALYPCTTLGTLYREVSAGGSTAIGCRDALQLGQVRYRLHEEIVELADPLYRVYRSLQQPGRFLVVPTRYAITRHPSTAGASAYRPCILLHAVIDPAAAANNVVVLDATLQPDLPVSARRLLLERLQRLAEAPSLHYPTDIDGASATFSWSISGSGDAIVTLVNPGGLLRVTIRASLVDWLLIRSQLQTVGIGGNARFAFPDGSAVQSALALDLTAITGPWERGPVEVALAGGQARLTNRVEHPVDVSDLLLFGPTAAGGRAPVEVTLQPSGTHSVPVPAGTSEAVPVVSIPGGVPATVEEVRSFIEDIDTNVVFLNLISFENHGLARLQIVARLQGVPGEDKVQLTDEVRVAEAHFVLPLTTYLERHMLEFQVTKHFTAGDPAATAWRTWDLATKGSVVSLNWPDIK